ncbi:hypothetical protein KKB44_02885 [Candidatus Micrarchaeota archaeon]|nr:hypothetical protein [Candidatus Micrarchaeota archaeon]
MKGLVITIDALVAVAFLFIAALILYTQTFQPYAPNGIYLKQITLDALTVMEKTEILDSAISGNSSGMRRIIETTPELVCMQISILNSSDDQILIISKNDCGEYGQELQVVIMPTVRAGEFYTVKAESWYRKEST